MVRRSAACASPENSGASGLAEGQSVHKDKSLSATSAEMRTGSVYQARRYLALGAAKLDGKNVYADPAGHPFCLIHRPRWAPPIPHA
jgi:hypothetical protein